MSLPQDTHLAGDWDFVVTFNQRQSTGFLIQLILAVMQLFYIWLTTGCLCEISAPSLELPGGVVFLVRGIL